MRIPRHPARSIKLFEPVVRYGPKEFHSAVAMGLSLTRANQVDQGIDQLRRAVQTHPGRIEAWDSLLTGLDESGWLDVLEEELARLPAAISESPRVLKHRARVAQGGSRWKEALDLYRRARAAEPDNRVVEYRLSRALRHAGEAAEADRIERRIRSRDAAIQELRPLFDQAIATPDLGIGPHRELYHRLADLAGTHAVAGGGRRLAPPRPGERPQNAVSLAALARLGDGAGSR